MKLTRLMRRMARRDFFKKNKEQNNPDNPVHGVDSRRHEEVALGVFPLPLSLLVRPAHSPRPDAPAVVLHQRHVLRVIPRPEPRDGAHHAGAGAAAANERARSRVRGCCGVRAGAGEATPAAPVVKPPPPPPPPPPSSPPPPPASPRSSSISPYRANKLSTDSSLRPAAVTDTLPSNKGHM
jgi:hypothetical protein